MAYIYKITNDINSKVYVGKTEKSINKRLSEHILESRKESRLNRPLYSAMRKYGTEHFTIELLEETEKPEDREIYWINYYDSYKSGYNATTGGDGKRIYDYDKIVGLLVLNPSATYVAKEIGCSTCTVRAVAKQYGIKLQWGYNDGLRRSDDSRKIRVVCHDGDEKLTFSSIQDAAEWLYAIGRTKSKGRSVLTHIADCARGKSQTAYGFKWSM